MYYFHECSFYHDGNSVQEDALVNTIRASAFLELLRVCCKNSAYFSLLHYVQQSEEKLPLPIYRKAFLPHTLCKCFYSCNEKTVSLLHSIEDDLFEWVRFDEPVKPENLTFYRQDGTVFFWSETHEGVCAMFPRGREDVSVLLAQGGWEYHSAAEKLYRVPLHLQHNSNIATALLRDKIASTPF